MRPWYEDGRKYQRFRIPAAMDSDRVVHRYQEVVVAEDAGPIQGQGPSEHVFEVDGDLISFL
jgi:CRISPR-associated protein Cas5h